MFVAAFRSEWLKRRRSSASLLLIGGSLFTPAIIAAVRLLHYKALPRIYADATFWTRLWRDSWESMAVFFLPMTAILAASLITQIEFRSNAWKQVHALPMTRTVLFLSKLAVIMVMLAQFLAMFVVALYLSAMLPVALVPGVAVPQGSLFALPLVRDMAMYFLYCLPIAGAQYAIALRFGNVFVPIGIGFMAWVGALAAVSSQYAIWWPYAYTTVQYIKDTPKGIAFAAHTELPWLALLSFLLVTAAGYWAFVTKKEKG